MLLLTTCSSSGRPDATGSSRIAKTCHIKALALHMPLACVRGIQGLRKPLLLEIWICPAKGRSSLARVSERGLHHYRRQLVQAALAVPALHLLVVDNLPPQVRRLAGDAATDSASAVATPQHPATPRRRWAATGADASRRRVQIRR